MDAMGHDILSENFENQTVDVSIRTNRDFDGNFTHFTTLFNESLLGDYPEIQNIFGSMKYDTWSTVYDQSQSINWSYYEENDFDWRLFNHSVFYGIQPEILNLDRMQEIIQFESSTGKFTLSQNEIYIDSQIAFTNNFSIGDNISIGNYFREWYPVEQNHTYSIENITIAGFFNILDEPKFNYLFPSNYVYLRDDSIQILTSETFAFSILEHLWNNLSYFEYYDSYQYENFWHIALVLDHTNYDYLNPNKIEVFYNGLITDICI